MVRFTAFAAVIKMDGARRTTLYRVAQEALTNVARHAQAHRVDVIIKKQENGICMLIQDDGKAFEVTQLMHGKKRLHLGLLGMRERVEMVGGRFSVESLPGKGTTIRAEIPLLAHSGTEHNRP